MNDNTRLCLLLVLVGLLLRMAIGFHPHSGMSKPPMYGDYEAQRHWMEITINLPVQEWYQNTTDNDLLYWGLDYPPLTAYHSWLCGKIGSKIVPKAFELHTSRGYQTPESKVYMRWTVMVADLLIFIPSVLFTVFAVTNDKGHEEWVVSKSCFAQQITIAAFLILHPGLIIIDHGHFQYNGIALGLSILGVGLLSKKYYLTSAVAFSLALNYKQMMLYYSPAFFFFIFSTLIKGKPLNKGLLQVLMVGVVVLSTFIFLWFPWIRAGLPYAGQVLNRVFPFDRGLYEDKVSNFWCSLSLIYKAHLYHTRSQLVKCSTLFTLIGFIPTSIHLCKRPSILSFIYSLVITSLSFYMFSFQVHEKTILIPLLPSCLLLARALPIRQNFHIRLFALTCTFNIIGLFSMYPLFIKDDTREAYYSTMTVALIFYNWILFKTSPPTYIKILSILSQLGMFIIHALSWFYTPPSRYPDIVIYLFSIYSFIHFFGIFISYNIMQWHIPVAKSLKKFN